MSRPDPEEGLVLAERFWSKVDRRGPDDCWEWQGYRLSSGYGQIRIAGTKWLAHRLAYVVNVGPIPEGLTIDHLCRNRACVNPVHLEVVTRGENVLRGEGVTAINAVKTECDHGHSFDAENTYIDRRGWRSCRACRRDRRRRPCHPRPAQATAPSIRCRWCRWPACAG